MSKRYRILAGIWFGKEKPVMSVFLKPFVESMQDLHSNGEILCLISDLKISSKKV